MEARRSNLEASRKASDQLNEIHEQFSQFDVKITKLKHDFGDWRVKSIFGKSTAFKQPKVEQSIQHL